MDNQKPWYKSKTIIANVITALIALLTMVVDIELFESITPYIIPIITFLNIALRLITSEGIAGAKEFLKYFNPYSDDSSGPIG